MVLKQNKLPFDHENSFQFQFQHIRQLDWGNQCTSSGHMHIPEQRLFPDDGVRPGGNLVFKNVNAVTSNGYYARAPDRSSDEPLVMTSIAETPRSESNSKRSLGDDDDFQVAAKRTRQMDGNFHSGNCGKSLSAFTVDEELKNQKDAAAPERAKDSHGNSCSFPWFMCSASEEGTRLETNIRLSFFPGYYENHHWAIGRNQEEECQSPVLSYHPRKPVSIGPDHQADIPDWRPNSFQDCRQEDGSHASTSCGDILTDEDCRDKWTGYCVMPMPKSVSLEEPLRHFKTDCSCLTVGSIICVRRHVMEARHALRCSLGDEQFITLGFCEMGEDVALRWTKEEEQLFHEVVASNPASLGKDFWDDLPLAFPSRSSKELVSYYFNVFMLRKRAEQNRSDPLNVDSDNDEWQESDDGEFGAVEDEEEDSGVESPADDAAYDNRALRVWVEDDIHEEAEEDDHEEEERGISDGFPGNSKLKFGPNVQSIGKNLHESSGEDQDVHDDSCTSYEGQRCGAEECGGADALEGLRDNLGEESNHGILHADYRNDGISGMTDPDFIVGHFESKPWEISYLGGLDKDMDFLPTCNVIEEVFGNESWEKNMEGNGVI